MVKHIIDRYFSLKCENVSRLDEKRFSVKSETGIGTYEVFMGDNNKLPYCTCLDWNKNRLPCKHFSAVFRCGSDWECLCPKYRNNPLYRLDDICFNKNNENQAVEIEEGEAEEERVDQGIAEAGVLEGVEEEVEEELEEVRSKDLPLRKKKKETKFRKKCLSLTKRIQDRLYLVQDEKFLENFHSNLEDLFSTLEPHIPNEEGMVLHNLKKKGQKRPAPLNPYPLPPKLKKCGRGNIGLQKDLGLQLK